MVETNRRTKLRTKLRSSLSLAAALGVRRGDVVCFVGGGGKTSTMFRLARELAAQGASVLCSTTTKMAAEDARHAQIHVRSGQDVPRAFSRSRQVFLTGKTVDGKLLGIRGENLCALRSSASHVLVEADGSRGLPFKAPGTHEPVIPACTTLVVPVVGVDAVGLPVAEGFVHRPQCIQALHPGPVVTPETVAAVLSHALGGRKHEPAAARVVPLINKVDSDERRRIANRIAELLLARTFDHAFDRAFDRVVCGCAIGEAPWQIIRPDEPRGAAPRSGGNSDVSA